MKKRLEADLISIAHRILKIKNKSDINQLYLETQKLYEKLSVLRFIEENYGTTKPTIDYAEMQKEIEDLYDRNAELPVETVIEMTESNVFPEASEETLAEETTLEEITPVEETAEVENLDEQISTEEELATEEITAVDESEITENSETEENSKVERTTSPEFSMDEMDEDIEEEETVVEEFEADIQELQPETEEKDLSEEESQESIVAEETVEDIEAKKETPPTFKAAFELTEDTELEVPKQPETMQISFADLLGGNYSEPHFVKVDDIEALPPITEFEAPQEKATVNIEETKTETVQAKSVSLNDKLSKGIDIDLNDRIAFVKHLFGNSTEDYNRVLNQLITFDNFYETKNFIEEMVKPDYNDWKGKDDYAERFMDIIEKKFL
ncbi:hypothetical protein [Flavobacterium frigoris]|uniref:Uncharacterized protein n=1 Tax=Flavobacterium frigoris (strain PS1) TaxID=1086011 RepID=H7FPQ1_FLAFP|nr:hypothetical protein [Flavobacterium frigoris]EIA09255.1 hypothetical protein HJ01_01161 [Flavobacterium frigoris PS1]